MHVVKPNPTVVGVSRYRLNMDYPILEQSRKNQLGSVEEPIDIIYCNKFTGFTPYQGPSGPPGQCNCFTVDGTQVYQDKDITPCSNASFSIGSSLLKLKAIHSQELYTENSLFIIEDMSIKEMIGSQLSYSSTGLLKNVSNHPLKVLKCASGISSILYLRKDEEVILDETGEVQLAVIA